MSSTDLKENEMALPVRVVWYLAAIFLSAILPQTICMQGRPPIDDTELVIRAHELFRADDGEWHLPSDPELEPAGLLSDEDAGFVIDKGWVTKEESFTGRQFRRMVVQPLVYMFIKDGRVTYVGMSRRGLSRPMNTHHAQWKARRECDTVHISHCKDVDSAKKLETFLISRLRPELNKTGSGFPPRWEKKAAS
jgi:hypothetical protein